MRPIFMPDRARALRADWAPGPGVFVLKGKQSRSPPGQVTHTHLGLKGLAEPGPAAMQSEAAGLSPVKPVRLTKVTINTRLLSIVRALNRPC